MASPEIDAEIESRLKSFPSLFNMDMKTATKTTVKIWLRKMRKEENEDTYPLPEEQIWTYNFMSFLYWLIGKSKEAIQYCHDAQKLGQKSNYSGMTAYANEAWMLLKNCEYSKCQELCDKLDTLSGTEACLVDAKAEQAYCYSRMGERHYEDALKLFGQVLDESNREHLNHSVRILCLFGYGLTLRRTSRARFYENDTLAFCTRMEMAFSAFFDITELSNDITYQARAFIELAELVFNVEKSAAKITLDMIFQENPKRTTITFDALCKNALKYGKHDHFVLTRCGKYLRYSKEYQMSKECLEKAIEMRETPFAHHHLALTLQAMLSQRVARTNSLVGTIGVSSQEKLHKCPRDVIRLNDNSETETIMKHLETAISDGNHNALYDKALLQRKLGRLREAKQSFAQVCCHEKTPQLDRGHAFEQQAWCLLDDPNCSKESHSTIKDIIHLLMNSIELKTAFYSSQSGQVKLSPALSTLHELLDRNEARPDDLELLAAANRNAGNYDTAAGIYRKIIGNDPLPSKTVLKKFISLQLDREEYTEAISLFNHLKLRGKCHINNDQYIRAHINGGFEALRRGQLELAKHRFQAVTSFGLDQSQEASQHGENADEAEFDFFILCQEDAEPLARDIWQMLSKHCCLSVTMNQEDVRLGVPKLSGTEAVLKKSKHFIIVVSGDEGVYDSMFADIMLMLHSQSKRAHRIVLVKPEDSKLPLRFQNCPWINHPDVSMVGGDGESLEEIYRWAEGLMWVTLQTTVPE